MSKVPITLILARLALGSALGLNGYPIIDFIDDFEDVSTGLGRTNLITMSLLGLCLTFLFCQKLCRDISGRYHVDRAIWPVSYTHGFRYRVSSREWSRGDVGDDRAIIVEV